MVGLAPALAPKRPLLGATARVAFLCIGVSASFDVPTFLASSAFLAPPALADILDALPEAIPAYPDSELLLLRAEPGSFRWLLALARPGCFRSILLFTDDTPPSAAAPVIELVFLCLANVDLPPAVAGCLAAPLLLKGPVLTSSSLPCAPGYRAMFFISADCLVGGRVSLSLVFWRSAIPMSIF